MVTQNLQINFLEIMKNVLFQYEKTQSFVFDPISAARESLEENIDHRKSMMSANLDDEQRSILKEERN